MKIVHVISGLNTGGAEMMLFKTLSVCDLPKRNILVVSLGGKGTMGSRIERLGVEVVELNLSRKSPVTISFFKKIIYIKKFKPDIFQGWMYHANIVAFFYALLFRKTRLFYGIRHSLYSVRNEKFLTRVAIYLCKVTSGYCQTVVYNSRKSMLQHVEYGFSVDNQEVIPNGFDVSVFSPSRFTSDRYKIKSTLNIPNDAVVIGVVARYHPMKGYENIFSAIIKVLKKYPDIHIVAIGKEVTNHRFDYMIDDEFKEKFHLLGESSEIPTFMSIFDIAVNGSLWGEAFSNAICEAMAMGIPCVVTDIGDSKYIVENCGVVVPPHDVQSLASGILKLLSMSKNERKLLGLNGRTRIVKNFSLDELMKRNEVLYKPNVNIIN